MSSSAFSDTISVGDMSSVTAEGTVIMDKATRILAGQFTQVVLGSSCFLHMFGNSQVLMLGLLLACVVHFVHALFADSKAAGFGSGSLTGSSTSNSASRLSSHSRALYQIFCNASWSMQTDSFINIQPQVFINVSAALGMGSGCGVAMAQSSVLEVGDETQLGDATSLVLGERSRFLVVSRSGAIVTVTGSPRRPTNVTLGEAVRLIIAGTCSIGNGQGTHMQLRNSAYLFVSRVSAAKAQISEL